MALPAPQRIILIPGASDEATAQLYIAKGRQRQPAPAGHVRGRTGEEPEPDSRGQAGPGLGRPGRLRLQLHLQQRQGALEQRQHPHRDQLRDQSPGDLDLGYEGANYPIVAVLGLHGPEVGAKGGPLKESLDKYDRGTPSQAKVDEHMGKAGYAKNADGKWAKDGTVLKVPVYGPSFFGPLAPPLTQMLNDAGFDAAQQLDEKYDTNVLPGNADTWFLVHCGSLSEPYDTLKDLNSKFSRPIGDGAPEHHRRRLGTRTPRWTRSSTRWRRSPPIRTRIPST